MKKGIRLHLDLELHEWLEKIQLSEKIKFSYPTKRKKEEVAEDVLKNGIQYYIKIHNLDIKL